MGRFTRKTRNLLRKCKKKLVPELKDMVYEDRLRSLNLPSLQHRRGRGDMIFTYKIMSGKVKLKPSKIFTMAKKTMGSHKSNHLIFYTLPLP